jgi:hypothetical protein
MFDLKLFIIIIIIIIIQWRCSPYRALASSLWGSVILHL